MITEVRSTFRISQPILFFDLDGTISDNHLGITGCIRHALSQMGISIELETRELLWCIGPPLRDSFRKLLRAHRAGERLVEANQLKDLPSETPDSELQKNVEQCVSFYRERFVQTGMFENRIYDGMAELLTEAGESGRLLVLVTTKPRLYAERILHYFGLRRAFFQVHGPEFDGTFGSKAALINHILCCNRFDPAETCMIGDTVYDIEAAKANRVHPIGVAWGWGERSSLKKAGATEVMETPADLRAAILQGPRKMEPPVTAFERP